ncbi:hypothetical protein BGZ73_003275 [Actinomortierella ambigua]|nr:hypothetical protein BGZ73_003275 [Actinomortierella ambigua]
MYHIFLALVLTLYLAFLAIARHDVDIYGPSRATPFRFTITNDESRVCWCINNTEISLIKGEGAGLIKMFSRPDCNGNYSVAYDFDRVITTNRKYASLSFGANGPASTGPYGHCPDWFANS